MDIETDADEHFGRHKEGHKDISKQTIEHLHKDRHRNRRTQRWRLQSKNNYFNVRNSLRVNLNS